MLADFSKQNSTIDSLLGYQLRRVSSLAMTKLAEGLAPLELRITDVTVLFQIAEQPGITSSEIGRVLGIRRANMTPLITGLIGRGYLNTEAIDGRSQALSLTRNGSKTYQQARKIVEQHEHQFFTAFSQNQKQQLSDLLTILWRHHSQE